jgi:hypothetical protein
LEAVIEQCKDVLSVIDSSLVARMEEDVVLVPNYGVLRRERKYASKWRDRTSGQEFRRNVFAAIAREFATDRLTGERDQMRTNAALTVLELVDEAIPAFSTLKAGGKRRLRVDESDWRETTEYYTVKLEQVGML